MKPPTSLPSRPKDSAGKWRRSTVSSPVPARATANRVRIVAQATVQTVVRVRVQAVALVSVQAAVARETVRAPGRALAEAGLVLRRVPDLRRSPVLAVVLAIVRGEAP